MELIDKVKESVDSHYEQKVQSLLVDLEECYESGDYDRIRNIQQQIKDYSHA